MSSSGLATKPVVTIAIVDDGSALCKVAAERSRIQKGLAFQTGQLATELATTFVEEAYSVKDGTIRTRFKTGLEKATCIAGLPGCVKLTSFDSMANTEQLLGMQMETVDLVVLCFSLLNKASLEATLLWAELIVSVDKTFTPIVLVGDHLDIRDGEVARAIISKAEGKHTADKIGALAYIEYSTREYLGVQELFEQVATFAYQAKSRDRPRFTMAEWKQKSVFRQAMHKLLSAPSSPMAIKNFLKIQKPYAKKDKSSKLLCLDWSGLGISHAQLELLITHIPPKIQHLDLSFNRLARIPEGLFPVLNRLKLLNVCGNLLQSLPPELRCLDMLQWKDNPLLLVPENIRKQHNYWQQMKSYLGSIANRAQSWKEVKLLLVGQEGVGKTTLMSPKSKTDVAENLSTDGVHIERGITLDTDSNVEFNVWDLGGQEVFYPTHQFFLTSNSIYVLVFDLTKPDEGRVEYWMRQIRTLSGNNRKSPIFIVATHCDDPSLQEARMMEILNDVGQKYPKYRFVGLQCIVPVSCKTGAGIDALKEKLVEVATQDWFLPRVAESWVNLHDFVRVQREQLQVDKVEWRTFSQWAVESGVPESELMLCTGFLTNVGSVIFYAEAGATADSAVAAGKMPAADDLVVLNPQWLADLMSCLITFRHSWIKDGKMRVQDLYDHIFASKYPRSVFEQLVALLERFAVIYQTSSLDLAGYVIVPSMLPETLRGQDLQRFEVAWPAIHAVDEVEYGREYTFPFLPLGFFEKIMVRVMHSSKVEPVILWRHGVVVRLGGQVGCLLFDQANVKFSLRIREPLRRPDTGQKRQLLLREIVDSVETVVECFYRMEADVSRQLPCFHCLASRDVQHVQPGQPLLPGRMQPVGQVKKFDFLECVEAVTANKTLMCGDVVVNISLLAPDLAFSDVPIIASSDLVLGRKLGEGGFGAVYLGELGEEKTKVAVKELLGNADESMDLQFSNFAQEVYIMSCLDHRCLVKLFGISKEPRLRMVLELVPCGDLFEFLHPKDKSDPEGLNRFTIAAADFPWPLRLKMALDMAEGMRYLQAFTPPIVHRDLRSPNIFLSSVDPKAPVCAKVADFGLSRMVAGNLAGALGTWQWLAPEVMNATDDSKYDERSDTYSFGICCWEIATRQFPFDEFSRDPTYLSADGRDINTLKIKTAISEDSLRPSFMGPEEGCPAEFERLIKQCWHTDPTLRPSFDYIVKKLYAISGLPMPTTVEEELRDVPSSFLPSFSSKSHTGAGRRSSVVLSNRGPLARAGSSSWAKTSDLSKLGVTPDELAQLSPKPLKQSKPMEGVKSLPVMPKAASSSDSQTFASARTKPLPKPPHTASPAGRSASVTATTSMPPPSYDEATRGAARQEPSVLGDAVEIVSVNASAAVSHVSTKFKSTTARLFRRKTEK